MFTTPSRARLSAALMLALACIPPLPAQAADDELSKLAARVGEAAGDREKLRQDLLAFRRAHPGTPQGARAAGLLAQLPSNLDKLDPKTIPALERFDWQPKELVAVLGDHRGRQGAPVSCVAFSPDGKTLASGGGSWVRLWDPATMRLRHALGHGGVTCLAFARDGKTLAVGGSGGVVQIWELSGEAPRLRFSITAATSPVYAVAIAPNNTTVAAGCFDSFTRLYDISGKEPKELATIGGHSKMVAALAYHPDGKTLATGSYDNSVRLWDLTGEQPREKHVLEDHTKEVMAVAFSAGGAASATGTLLATAGSDGTARVYTLPVGARPKERTVLAPQAGAIYGVTFSPNGRNLALACADSTVRLWNVAAPQPKELAKVAGHIALLTAVAYSPDARLLATGSSDWTARTWDLAATPPRERFMPTSHLSHGYALAFSPDGQTLASGSEDRTTRLWDLSRTDVKTRLLFKGDGAQVYTIAFAPDGKAVAVGGNSTTLRLYESATGRDYRKFTGLPSGVGHAVFSPDGQQLLCSSQKEILLFDVARGRELRRLSGHEAAVNALAYSGDGRYAVSGGGQYKYENGQIVYKLGKPVYVDCTLRLWDVDSGREVQSITSHTVPIYSAAFTPDGRRVFTGAYEALARQWDLKEGALSETGTVKGGSGFVHSLVFAPDGETFITRGIDGKIIQWETATGKRVREWVFNENVGWVAYAPDGRHLAVSLGTGVIYLLRLAPPGPRA